MARQQGNRQGRSFRATTVTAARTATLEACGAGEVRTRATYRLLLMRGLGPAAAANLTAYVCGIDTSDTSWSIAEINRLLFLRSLARSGQWGDREGAPSQQDWPAAA